MMRAAKSLAEDFFRADAFDAGDILADVPDEGAVAADASEESLAVIAEMHSQSDESQISIFGGDKQ